MEGKEEEHESLIGCEDVQSWVFNQLPLSVHQKLDLLKVLRGEIKLDDHLLAIEKKGKELTNLLCEKRMQAIKEEEEELNELDKEQNCEKTIDNPVALDVQDLCLNDPKKLD